MTTHPSDAAASDSFEELVETRSARSLAETDTGPAHGMFRPGLTSRLGLTIGRALPAHRVSLRLAGIARPLAMSALKDGMADVEAFGLKLRLHPEETLAERRVFLTPQCYEPDEMAALHGVLGAGRTFIDIGAGAGLHALVAAKAGGRGCRVIAVEPRSDLRRRIAHNARANSLSNVEVSGVALADYEGESVMRLVGEAADEAVRVTRLATLMAEMRIASLDALKLSADGSELAILAPWFADTTRERWPSLMILRRPAGKSPGELRDAISLACSRGYTMARETPANVLLRLGRA